MKHHQINILKTCCICQYHEKKISKIPKCHIKKTLPRKVLQKSSWLLQYVKLVCQNTQKNDLKYTFGYQMMSIPFAPSAQNATPPLHESCEEIDLREGKALGEGWDVALSRPN